MTPFLDTATAAEERFNTSLMRTRVLIEQTFGMLKRRFQLLHNEIRTKPIRAIVYTTSCQVLHNIGIDRGDIIDRDEVDNEHDHARDAALPAGICGDDGVRRHILHRLFA